MEETIQTKERNIEKIKNQQKRIKAFGYLSIAASFFIILIFIVFTNGAVHKIYEYRITKMEGTVVAKNNEINRLLSEIDSLNTEISSAGHEISNLESERSNLYKTLSSKDEKITSLNNEISNLKASHQKNVSQLNTALKVSKGEIANTSSTAKVSKFENKAIVYNHDDLQIVDIFWHDRNYSIDPINAIEKISYKNNTNRTITGVSIEYEIINSSGKTLDSGVKSTKRYTTRTKRYADVYDEHTYGGFGLPPSKTQYIDIGYFPSFELSQKIILKITEVYFNEK